MGTFAARGYNNASLQEIADRAGVIQAGVLHSFRSKPQLLTSVLALRDDTDIEQLGTDRPRGLAFLRHLVDTVRRNTAFAEASELGETRPGLDVEEAATAIIAVMDGLQIQWLLAPDSVDMAPTTDRVINALLTDITESGN
jgi:AcrR family transcriptional regulator